MNRLHVEEGQGLPPVVEDFIIHQKDNNLDGLDNLERLPTEPAVYGIFGRLNGIPANCRYIGYTDDLRQAVKRHFSEEEPDEALRWFMQSIKIKTINFLIVTGFSEEGRMPYYEKWRSFYMPGNTEVLNKVY